MEIKIIILQDQKQTISREFTSPADALAYLQSVTPADEVKDESLSDPTHEDPNLAEGTPSAFTNDQRFEIGQHVMFHQLVGEYSGEHIIEEEQEAEVGYKYRTDHSDGVFIHAHWFAPVAEESV